MSLKKLINKFKQLFNKKIILKLQNYKNRNKYIYKVEYVTKSYLFEADCYYKNIVIEDLKLSYYENTQYRYHDYFFQRYDYGIHSYNSIPFSQIDKSSYFYKIKFIEINEQLQQLLYSEDVLNKSLGKEIIFQKLGINYE